MQAQKFDKKTLLMQKYRSYLSEKNIHFKALRYYQRWLHLYLEFCAQRQYEPLVKDNVFPFLQSISPLTPTPFLQEQAKSAIFLYFDLQNPDSPISHSPSAYPDTFKKKSEQTQKEDIAKQNSLALKQASLLCAKHPPQKQLNEPIQSNSHQNNSMIQCEANHELNEWRDLYKQLESAIRVRNYSLRTYKSYAYWLRSFQGFVQHRPPKSLSGKDVREYLSHLASEKKVAAGSQNQAFHALHFVFEHLLRKDFRIRGVVRAKRKPYIPVVLSRREVDLIIKELPAPYDLVAKLLYGCGLRLSECLNLRIQDLNFDMNILTIHQGKGQKDLQNPDYEGVFLPNLLSEKYKNAGKSLNWQWLFPGIKLTQIPQSQIFRRYHLHESHVQKSINQALKKAMLTKRASAHSFRHSFASHLLQANVDICTIQQLLGHSDIRTTMIYIQTVPSQTLKQAISPLDLPTASSP